MAGPHNVVQVYLGWANSIFNERGVHIASLSELHNGRLLFELLAALGSNRGGHDLDRELASLDGKSSFEAVAEVFRWLGIFGVKLSASAADVTNGSMKALLDVLWEMILHLTIHSPDRKAAQRTESIGAKLLMEWCSRMVGDVTFDYRKSIAENLTKEILLRLINKCFDAASSSPKERSSSFYTAVTEAESRLGVSSMLLRTSNDAAAGYGLMVYVALLKRKVELAATGKPVLKKDDYRRDAVHRAAFDASVRQQLKLQQERTQQVLKDLENQLDSFKKLRQDSGVASQSKSSGDISFTGAHMEKSLGSTSPGLATDDDTLRASHSSFDTALHDALSIDLGAFSQAAHTDATHNLNSGYQSVVGCATPAGDAAVCPEANRISVVGSANVPERPSDDDGLVAPTEAAAASVHHTVSAPTAVAAAVCSVPDVVEQWSRSASAAGELRTAAGPAAASDQHSTSATVASSWPSVRQPQATSQLRACAEAGRSALGSDGLLSSEDFPSHAMADPSAGRDVAASPEYDDDRFSDLDIAGRGVCLQSQSGQQHPAGTEKERSSRRASIRSTATAVSEHACSEERFEHAETTYRRSHIPLPMGRSRSGIAGQSPATEHRASAHDDRDGSSMFGVGSVSPELLLSLLIPDSAGGRLLLPPPALESTSYAESDDFLLAWLTSSPDGGANEATAVEERGAGGVGTSLTDDILMVALDKIGRRNEVILAQLHDSRCRELELLRRLTERDDLIVRLHGSLLLQQQRRQQRPSGARHHADALADGSAAAGKAAEDASHENDHAERNGCRDDAGNNAEADGEREWYRHTVVQLHDELARCRFKVIAPLQDENRMLRKRLQLLEEQHTETFRALQDERLAQERLIVSMQLEMTRFDRLMASGVSLTSVRGTSVLGETRMVNEPSKGRVRSSMVPRTVPRRESGGPLPYHHSSLHSTISPKDLSDQSLGVAMHDTQETECAAIGSSANSGGDRQRTGSQTTTAMADRTSTACNPAPGLGCALTDDGNLCPEPGFRHEIADDQGSRNVSAANTSGTHLDARDAVSVSAAGGWLEAVHQQLAHFRKLFDSTEPLDDETIVRAAFSLLSENVSQRMVTGGESSSSSPVVQQSSPDSQLGQLSVRSSGSDRHSVPCGNPEEVKVAHDSKQLHRQRRSRKRDQEEELYRLQHEVIRLQALVDALQHDQSDRLIASNSLDMTSKSPDSMQPLSTPDLSARAEIERLRLKEETMNREFASKIAVMDDLLRAKIEETHSLQDANMVLASQRDRYEMQCRQSEQECDALRGVLRQYDEARQAAIMATVSQELALPPSFDVTSSPTKADEANNHSKEHKASNDASRGCSPHSSATSSPCRRESDSGISGVQMDAANVRRSGDGRELEPVPAASTAAGCQELPSSQSLDCKHPLPVQPAAAQRSLSTTFVQPSGAMLQELDLPQAPVSPRGSPERQPSTGVKLSPLLCSYQPAASVAAERSSALAPATTTVSAPVAASEADINDAIISELAALNQVTEGNWEPHHRPSGSGRGASAELRPSHTVKIERRRPTPSGDIASTNSQRQTTTSANGSHVPPSLRQRTDSVRGSLRSDSDASHVKSRARPAATSGAAVASKQVTSAVTVTSTHSEPAASRRSRTGTTLRRYEDGGPNPPALFPILLEPARRSRKL